MLTPSLSQLARCLLVALGLLELCSSSAGIAHAAGPAVRLVADPQGRPAAFEAIGITDPQLTSLSATNLNEGPGLRLFTVHVAEPGKPTDQQPMLGTYRWQGSALRFTPQFPLVAGVSYRAEFRADAKVVIADTVALAAKYRETEYQGKPITLDITIPKAADLKPTVVSHIYPSANILPENQLKFYLHFSAPMSRRGAYEHLELLKTDGTAVDLPFLELGEELWDQSGTRLTLLIDPGRIKRGVKPREDLGPALADGQKYTLVVHSDWKDATGNRLSREARKTFRAGPPVETAIDTADWKIDAPRASSKKPLAVMFPRSLDRALLERTIKVRGPGKVYVPGQVTVSDTERRWAFEPDQSWMSGDYELVVDTILEDLAGNRIGRPFEVDQEGIVDQRVQPESVSVPFKVVK